MSKATTAPGEASTPMTPEAQNFYDTVFIPQYRELQRKVKETPLMVLIWGPGPGGGDLYQKRLQIREQLLAWGHAAKFSEDIDLEHPAPDLSAKARELLQAIAADFIVILQGSPGSIAEVHDVAGFIREIGSKMLIFIDERAQEGYSYTGALHELKTLYNNVETYNYPRDIQECLLIQIVQEKAQVLQWVKWRTHLR